MVWYKVSKYENDLANSWRWYQMTACSQIHEWICEVKQPELQDQENAKMNIDILCCKLPLRYQIHNCAQKMKWDVGEHYFPWCWKCVHFHCCWKPLSVLQMHMQVLHFVPKLREKQNQLEIKEVKHKNSNMLGNLYIYTKRYIEWTK